MTKRKTHLEQVLAKVAKKVASEEIKRQETSPMNTGSEPKTASLPVDAAILVVGGLRL
jgi:hypothetical protein